jgi:replicative superfamily II helicase
MLYKQYHNGFFTYSFLLMLTASIQIVGMSATIGNLHEVATFLDAEMYTQDFHPEELKEYVKCEDGLFIHSFIVIFHQSHQGYKIRLTDVEPVTVCCVL